MQHEMRNDMDGDHSRQEQEQHDDENESRKAPRRVPLNFTILDKNDPQKAFEQLKAMIEEADRQYANRSK